MYDSARARSALVYCSCNVLYIRVITRASTRLWEVLGKRSVGGERGWWSRVSTKRWASGDYYIRPSGYADLNNQIPGAIFISNSRPTKKIRARRGGEGGGEIRYFHRAGGRFKDYFHVRPSVFRWWKDTRFNQVNAAQPLCAAADRTLPPPLVSAWSARHAHPCLRVRADGEGRQGDFYGTLHTFETCGNACRTGSVLASRVLTITFLPDWLREKWLRVNLGNRFFDTYLLPPSHGKQKYFPRLFGYRSGRADFSTNVRNSLFDDNKKFLTWRNLIE